MTAFQIEPVGHCPECGADAVPLFNLDPIAGWTNEIVGRACIDCAWQIDPPEFPEEDLTDSEVAEMSAKAKAQGWAERPSRSSGLRIEGGDTITIEDCRIESSDFPGFAVAPIQGLEQTA